MPDGVLAAEMSRAQDIKHLFQILTARYFAGPQFTEGYGPLPQYKSRARWVLHGEQHFGSSRCRAEVAEPLSLV